MASSPTPAASTGMSNNVAGALCYLFTWVTGLIFLLIEPYKNDKTVRFHAFQSIFFAVGMIAVYIAVMILGIILGVIHLGLLILPIWALLGLGIFATWVFLMFKAYNNQIFKLPIIGDLAAKQAGL
ncbi:MAG TPA: hypothetical protein VKL40_12555 [Candidatus Angelobacter sp.]|nr:hypothetical protein [Candidatus Angelobacter sp.]